METGIGSLGRMQECHIDMQRWNRKAKVQEELNLVKDVKKNKIRFCRYSGQKRQVKESVSHRINEKGKMASTDVEKAEVLSKFFKAKVLCLHLRCQ